MGELERSSNGKGFLTDVWRRLNTEVSLGVLDTPIPLGFLDYDILGGTAKKRRVRRAAIKRRIMTESSRTTEVAAPTENSNQFSLIGDLELSADGMLAIGGEKFIVDSDTWIIGDLVVGGDAKVKGIYRRGARLARSIIVR